MIAVDCETTGIDRAHGARPFFVSVYDGVGNPEFWSWRVDPLTRRVLMDDGDAAEIRQRIGEADRIVGQNLKFDAAMFREAGIIEEWPWEKTEDTLIAGHLMRSDKPHDLTSMTLTYLGKDIEPHEAEMKRVVQKARNWARRHAPDWRIAKEGLEEMPSAKEATWAFDMWLLQHFEEGAHYPLVQDYACVDPWATFHLWQVFEAKLKEWGLWEIYREGMRTASAVYDMESRGVTVLMDEHAALKEEYRRESEEHEGICVDIAAKFDYDLQLPKSGNNKSLGTFAFEVLKLPVLKMTESGKQPAMDQDVMAQWPLMLDAGSDQAYFVKALKSKRKRDTAIGFLDSYAKFWLPLDDRHARMYASANQTATRTLRFSMSNPNLQQVSKQETVCPECDGEGCEDCGGTGEDLHSVRRVFGPLPGREWWCLDYENIELRIPAYEAGEECMIELFERPDDPPFFGSYHLFNASIVYPDLFWPIAGEKGAFKKRYASAEYQWCKNGDFAIGYGCMEAKADATFRRRGAYRAIKEKTPKVTRLNAKYVEQANRQGYVETLPDRSIGAKRGYPIWCPKEYGKVKPTIPFNYHVQSTAMWCTRRAMVRCKEYLDAVSEETGRDYFVCLQVHDEIVFDFPAGGKRNLPKVRRLKALMEQSGEDVGIPLKVAYSYHPRNWSEAVKL